MLCTILFLRILTVKGFKQLWPDLRGCKLKGMQPRMFNHDRIIFAR